jgi:hypothetical protein
VIPQPSVSDIIDVAPKRAKIVKPSAAKEKSDSEEEDEEDEPEV